MMSIAVRGKEEKKKTLVEAPLCFRLRQVVQTAGKSRGNENLEEKFYGLGPSPIASGVIRSSVLHFQALPSHLGLSLERRGMVWQVTSAIGL